MPICEECQYHEATMIVDDRWICGCCTGPVCGDPDCPNYPGPEDDEYDDEEEEHDPECRCDDCKEAAIEVAVLFDMGRLP